MVHALELYCHRIGDLKLSVYENFYSEPITRKSGGEDVLEAYHGFLVAHRAFGTS